MANDIVLGIYNSKSAFPEIPEDEKIYVARDTLTGYKKQISLKVNWNSVKNWLFNTSSNNCSDEAMLKAFIRTQIYRPLFFKYDNYVDFTSNSSAYTCTTEKYFIDHVGNEHPLPFDNWPEEYTLKVDDIKELLESPEISNGEYTVSRDTIQYFHISNKFEYVIAYNQLQIVDNKFVLNDVEYYVVRPDVGTGNLAVNSIYFNEFQGNLEGQNQIAKVTSNRFTLNGKEFAIDTDRNEVSVDSATESFTGEEKEWKCDISDGQFHYDGTWYTLVKDDNGNYAEVQYSDPKDKKLVKIPVTDDGVAEYKPWGLKFQFEVTGDNAWMLVQVVKKHQSDVVDRFVDEWCEFDGPVETPTTYDITPDKTFNWYIANELVRIQKTYLSQCQALDNLGGGVLYNGGLELATKPEPPTECKLHIRNELQNGDVVTVCELVKKYGENDLVEYLGTLFDRDMNLMTDRAFRGNMDDGLVSTDEGGPMRHIIFMKTYDGGKNNINAAWADYANWGWSIAENVEQGTLDAETKEISLAVGASSLKLTPIYNTDAMNGVPVDSIVKYLITVDDGVEQYEAWVNGGDYVHFLVAGNRYRLKLSTNTVDRLDFRDIAVETVDFSTSYSPDQLRDNLAQNIKQAMLYFVVQRIMDNRRLDSSSTLPLLGTELLVLLTKKLDLYSDLFTDAQSLDDYIIAWGLDANSDNCAKFSQVFKNNLQDLDESGLPYGYVYGHLKGKLDGTFGINTSILVVDSPSIEVRRVSQVDTFKYEVLMNLHIMQNKDWMKTNKRTNEGKFVLGNAVVHDMLCTVTFTPKYTPSNVKMTYDVVYNVEKGKYDVTYNQIIYVMDGKTKHMSIPERTIASVDFAALTDVNLEKSYPGKELGNITNELLQDQIEQIFTQDNYKKLFKFINNQLSSSPEEANNNKEIVDNNVVSNPGKQDNIWEIGDNEIKCPADSELLSVNRGNTYIRGELYNVQDEDVEDMKLVPATGSKTYKIKQLAVHEPIDAYVAGALCTDTDPAQFKYVDTFNKTT